MENLNSFFQLRKDIYNGDAFFPSNIDNDLEELFQKNPFNAKLKIFMNNSTRLLGIIHENFEVEGEKTAMFGYFDSFDDQQSCQEVFLDFEQWAKEQGAKAVLGPMNFSTYLPYRIRLNNFDTIPFAGEPYNKPYYQKLLQGSGYQICQRYYSLKADRFPEAYRGYIGEKDKANEFSELREFSIHSISEELFQQYFKEFCFFIDQTFKLNAYYQKIPEKLFFKLYHNIPRYLDPNASRMILDKDGHVAAFTWLFPDFSALSGKSSTLSGKPNDQQMADISYKTHFDQLKKKNLLIKSVGVHPKYRKLNLFGFLMKDTISYADEHYDSIQACNMQEGGVTAKYCSAFHTDNRTDYALFSKKL